MRSRLATLGLPLALAGLVFVSSQASADYVRIEVGASSDHRRIPQTFPDLMERFTTSGYTAMWPDGPYQDPMATSYGPGEYGSFTVVVGNEEVYVTWVRADALQAAEQTEIDARSYATPGSGMAVVRDGHVIVTITSYTGNDPLVQELLDTIGTR